MSPETQAPTPRPAKTISHVLGEIVWLMTQSPLHKQLFVGDLEWFAMPPILLEQFRVFYGPTQPGHTGARTPAACALWAFVSSETAARLEAGATKLAPHEWKAPEGEPWLVELVAPFGAQEEILRDLAANVFKDRPFKFHMTGADGRRGVVSSADLSGARI